MPGFSGVLCQTNIDECASAPCDPLQSFNCTDDINAYHCLCRDGYSGERCQTDFNECASAPCLNGGTCTEPGLNRYACTCPSGYAGAQCQTDVNECASAPCLRGVCRDGVNRFVCDCPGYSGATCTQDINECLNATICSSFPNHALCSNMPGNYTCPYIEPNSIRNPLPPPPGSDAPPPVAGAAVTFWDLFAQQIQFVLRSTPGVLALSTYRVRVGPFPCENLRLVNGSRDFSPARSVVCDLPGPGYGTGLVVQLLAGAGVVSYTTETVCYVM